MIYPNYFDYLRSREINTSQTIDDIIITQHKKWYLMINQINTTLTKHVMGWYVKSYYPLKEEIPMYIKGERLLSLNYKTVEEMIRSGYKDVILYFMRKDTAKLRERVEHIERTLGTTIAAREILEYMEAFNCKIEKM